MANGQFHKPPNMKYTDMCIYIDKNMHWCKETGAYPEIENRIFEYLYHIIYAISRKGNMFPDFSDYEPFALQTAGELFLAMRDKYLREGQLSRSGKVIVPVKNTLDYINAVLFPLKVNYQRANYSVVINPEVDMATDILSNDMREAIRSDYRDYLKEDIIAVIENIDEPLNKLLYKTPYRKSAVMIERLKISCLLTFLGQMTLPTKLDKKFDGNLTNPNNEKKFLNSHLDNCDDVYLWHLEPGLKDYVKLLVTMLKDEVGKQIHDVRQANDLSDSVVDDIMATAYATYEDREEDEY